VLLLPVFGLIYVACAASADKDKPRAQSEDLRPPALGVVKYLEDRVALGTNGLFRGSVSLQMAVPGGAWLSRFGIPESTPFSKQFIQFFEGSGPSFAPDFRMSGLWDHRIPTLEDNNHMVTPPFHFLISRALSRPQDYHSRNWAVTTKPN